MKNLVYFTIGCDTEFVDMLAKCISTIRDTNDMSKLDILVMCDEEFKKHVTHLETKIYITRRNDTGVQSSMRKVEIFNYPDIFNYNNVLFLDCDVIVCGDLTPLFCHPLEEDIIYVRYEPNPDPHRNRYWSLLTYTNEDIEWLTSNGIKGFNCGQFLFKASETMKQHFDTVLDTITNHKGDYFYEQGFMNTHFNLKGKVEYPLLEEHVVIMPGKYDSTKLVHHFAGTGTRTHTKLERMTTFFNDYQAKYPLDYVKLRLNDNTAFKIQLECTHEKIKLHLIPKPYVSVDLRIVRRK